MTFNRPGPIDDALWALCLQVDTACVSDVLNARGISNKAMRPGLDSIGEKLRAVSYTHLTLPTKRIV